MNTSNSCGARINRVLIRFSIAILLGQIFCQNTRSGDFEGFDLSKTRVGGSDVFRFLISSAAGQNAQLLSSTAISTGVWYHVAGLRGSNVMQLYVNGALERQTNITFAQDY